MGRRAVSYICHHVNQAFVATIEATFPRLAFFLQLLHFLCHLNNKRCRVVRRKDTIWKMQLLSGLSEMFRKSGRRKPVEIRFLQLTLSMSCLKPL